MATLTFDDSVTRGDGLPRDRPSARRRGSHDWLSSFGSREVWYGRTNIG
jgi:hypothetical protein